MQLVLDMSETCAMSTDMAPNRAVAIVALATTFITEFFDQNPLSQMSVLVMRHGRAQALSDFSASPAQQKRALEGEIDTGGAVSLQNMLEQVSQVRYLA
jgi:transcription initiation factor TFIIH subunit 2